MKQKQQKGFTLIELLVVISIVGFLAALILISLNNARIKSRDIKRVADIKQLMSGLELYQNVCLQYPIETTPVTLGATGNMRLFSGTPADCGNDSGSSAAHGGFGDTVGGTTFIALIPTAPLPADSSACQTGTNNSYVYTSAAGTTYSLTFCLGGSGAGFPAGIRTAGPSGIQ